MLSTHTNRLASSCTALALCFPVLSLTLVPHIGAAQTPAKKSAQSSETQPAEPFFYKELTRDGLGNIENLDAQNEAKGRVAPDGHMIITGANTIAYVPAGKFIQLLPNFDIPGFKAVTWRVFENNQPTAQTGGLEMVEDQKPIIIAQPASGGSNRRLIQVVAYDGQGQLKTVMQCILRYRVASDNIADLDLNTSKERCHFSIKDNQTLTARHLYLGDICLGRVADKAGKIDIDERRLAPGRYVCKMIAANEDEVLLPGPTTEFVVAKRYTITPNDASSKIVIPEENLDTKLEVTVAHKPDLDIVKTKVFIAGLPAGEGEGADFKIKLPLRDVPSGKTSIEVIGVASDGVEYPVENLVVDLDNGVWWSRIRSTEEYQHIQEDKAKIKDLNVEMHGWLKKAEYTPEILHTKTVYTLRSITEHFAVSKKGEYMRKAAECLTKMADLQYDAGMFYRKLKMLVPAKSMFNTVRTELGTETLGEKAQAALVSLTKTQ